MTYKVILLLALISQACAEIPDPYYQPVLWADHSTTGLALALQEPLDCGGDCSNKAGYLEWRLENLGFSTQIVASHHFDRYRELGHPNLSHAWIKVDIGKDVYVDPVLIGDADYPAMYCPGDAEYCYYDEYEKEYGDIYEVEEWANLTEFRWWA